VLSGSSVSGNLTTMITKNLATVNRVANTATPALCRERKNGVASLASCHRDVPTSPILIMLAAALMPSAGKLLDL
jgi:hypothetical protein